MIKTTTLADCKIGDEITVWRSDGTGQGGVLEQVLADGVTIRTPAAGPMQFLYEAIDHIAVDRPGLPTECLEYGPDCDGPVEMWHSGGMNGRSWPRCTFHGKRRLQRYETSIEKEAASSTPPSWFDPANAGESWDED